MDSRLRFLHRLENDAMTQKDSMSRVMVNSVSTARAMSSEVRSSYKPELKRERSKSSEACDFTLARKVAGLSKRRPYRNPTQVGEVRILRRTGESLLRNSAN